MALFKHMLWIFAIQLALALAKADYQESTPTRNPSNISEIISIIDSSITNENFETTLTVPNNFGDKRTDVSNVTLSSFNQTVTFTASFVQYVTDQDTLLPTTKTAEVLEHPNTQSSTFFKGNSSESVLLNGVTQTEELNPFEKELGGLNLPSTSVIQEVLEISTNVNEDITDADHGYTSSSDIQTSTTGNTFDNNNDINNPYLTFSEEDMNKLSATSSFSELINYTDQETADLNAAIATTASYNILVDPEETTYNYFNNSTQLHENPITSSLTGDTNTSIIMVNFPAVSNEIVDDTLSITSETLPGEIMSTIANASSTNIEQSTLDFTGTGTDNPLSSSTFNEYTTTSISQLTSLTTEYNLMKNTENDIYVNSSQIIPLVAMSSDEPLTEPRTESSITEFFRVTEHSSTIHSTEISSLTTNLDTVHDSSAILNESVIIKVTTMSSNHSIPDSTETGIINTTRSLPTMDQQPWSTDKQEMHKTFSENASTTASIFHSSTRDMNTTRMPKILSVLFDSVTPVSQSTSTITITQNTSVPDEFLSSIIFDSTTDFEHFISTESSSTESTGTTSFAGRNETLRILAVSFYCISDEDLEESDKINIITASFTILIEKPDKEWLLNKTALFQMWLHKIIVKEINNFSVSWMNEGRDENHSLDIIFILPTPSAENYQLVFTFIVKNMFKNESVPGNILTPILTSNANEILNMLNATVSYFNPGVHSDFSLVNEGGIFGKLLNEYPAIFITGIVIFFFTMIISSVAICCIRFKKCNSANFPLDKENLEHDMHLEMDIGHINFGHENFSKEKCIKPLFPNGVQLCSVDDNEGWLVPMGQKPVVDLNAPTSQDTPM